MLNLLHFTAKEIVDHISKGEWTASEVLEAYIARAVLAQDLTNCLTEGEPISPTPLLSLKQLADHDPASSLLPRGACSGKSAGC